MQFFSSIKKDRTSNMPSFTRYNTKHSSLNMIHALLYIILEVTGTCINDIKKMAFYFNDRKTTIKIM